jgi:hypothetical protein
MRPERPGGAGDKVAEGESVVGVEGGEVGKLIDKGVGDEGIEGEVVPGTTSG